MNHIQDRQISLVGLAVMAGMIGLLFMLAQTGRPQFGRPQSVISAIGAMPPALAAAHSGKPDSTGSTLDALPPTAAGQPSSLAPAPAATQPPEAYLGGKLATGRVAEVYIRVAENVFLALDRAPPHLRDSAERWVDVEFPELLANDTGSARAILNRSDARVAVGDVVEIKFAHKDNPRYFPVKELTRVTELVASKGQMLARDYERRILARNGQGNPRPQWLSQAPAAQPAEQALQTTAADTRR